MKYDPEGQCMPPGGPRMFATPYPMEIIQSPETKRIWMVFEGGTHVWREIHMDGRAHPKNDTIKGLPATATITEVKTAITPALTAVEKAETALSKGLACPVEGGAK